MAVNLSGLLSKTKSTLRPFFLSMVATVAAAPWVLAVQDPEHTQCSLHAGQVLAEDPSPWATIILHTKC